jgi:hypothetical protein
LKHALDFRERFHGADVVHVIYGTRGRLDWERLRQLAGEHWQILLWELVLFHYVYPTKTEYVPRWVWDDLLSRLRRDLESPSAGPAFRGTLIDERMLAIDVDEWGLENPLPEYRRRREPKITEASKLKPAA